MGLCGRMGGRMSALIKLPDPKAEERKAEEARKQAEIDEMRKRYEEMKKRK